MQSVAILKNLPILLALPKRCLPRLSVCIYEPVFCRLLSWQHIKSVVYQLLYEISTEKGGTSFVWIELITDVRMKCAKASLGYYGMQVQDLFAELWFKLKGYTLGYLSRYIAVIHRRYSSVVLLFFATDEISL